MIDDDEIERRYFDMLTGRVKGLSVEEVIKRLGISEADLAEARRELAMIRHRCNGSA